MKIQASFALVLALALFGGCDLLSEDDPGNTADGGGDVDGDTDSDNDLQEPEEKWIFLFPESDEIQESSDYPLALASDGTIYAVATPFGNGAKLYAIDSDGNQKWVNTDLPTAWADDCLHPVLSEATSTIYVVCDEELDETTHVTRVYAISSTGALRWVEELPEGATFPNQIALYSDGNPPSDHLLIQVNSVGPSNGVYPLDSNGNQGAPYLIDNDPLFGLAVDRQKNILVRTKSGLLIKLSAAFSTVWEHTLSSVPAAETMYALSVGPDGTVYVATSEPKLFAIAEDALGKPFEKWTYQNQFYTLSEPVFGVNGEVYIYEADHATVALSPTDGAVIWSDGFSHSWTPAMTALADGSMLAGANYGHNAYDANGTRTFWLKSDGRRSAAVGTDGSIYATGQYDNNISNAIFAYSWMVGPAEDVGWYRGNADNGNTRWAGP